MLDWLNFHLGEMIGLMHAPQKRYYQNNTQLRYTYNFGSVYIKLHVHVYMIINGILIALYLWKSYCLGHGSSQSSMFLQMLCFLMCYQARTQSFEKGVRIILRILQKNGGGGANPRKSLILRPKPKLGV